VLKRLLENHVRYTGSTQARNILENWAKVRSKFVKVFPREYRRALTEIAAKSKKIAA
jgi:glutamate synthase domain-containing protein 3